MEKNLGQLISRKPGENPRWYTTKHMARGMKKFHYTYEDLSRLLGLSVNTLKIYASKKKFDPSNLVDIFRYYQERKLKETEMCIPEYTSKGEEGETVLPPFFHAPLPLPL